MQLSDSTSASAVISDDHTAAVTASRLLETVATDQGLCVRRFTDELVHCGDGDRTVLFHGCAGAQSGKATELLCGNVAWQRQQLARGGLPVIATRLVDAYHPRLDEIVGAVGFPARLRLTGESRETTIWTVSDRESVLPTRRELAAARASDHDRVAVEPCLGGTAVGIAVVAGNAVVSSPPISDQPEHALDIAAAAVSRMPNMNYGWVRLIVESGRTMIDRVETSFHHKGALTELGYSDRRQLMKAIIQCEFSGRSEKRSPAASTFPSST